MLLLFECKFTSHLLYTVVIMFLPVNIRLQPQYLSRICDAIKEKFTTFVTKFKNYL